MNVCWPREVNVQGLARVAISHNISYIFTVYVYIEWVASGNKHRQMYMTVFSTPYNTSYVVIFSKMPREF